MIFLIEYLWRSIPDPGSAAYRRHRDALIDAEASGAVTALWHKASGQGDVLVVDVPDHDRLRAFLRGLPLSSEFERITATPLVAHESARSRP